MARRDVNGGGRLWRGGASPAAALIPAMLLAAALAAPQPGLAQGKAAVAPRAAFSEVGKGGEAAKDDRPALNRTAAVGSIVKDPVAEAKREIGASCLSVTYPKDFVSWSDINQDEVPDAFVSFDVVCDGYRGAFCGVGGCAGRVFVSQGEGAFIKTSLPGSAEPTEPYKGLPAVKIPGKGSECGYYYTEDTECSTTRVWDGRDFVDPELLTEEGRRKAAERMAASVQEAHARAEEEEKAKERAVAESDAEKTAALFQADAPEDPEWSARLAEIYAAGDIEVLDPITTEITGERWSYEPMGEGRARAWIESDYGYASLQIACRAGDETIGLAFSGETGMFAPGAGFDSQSYDADLMVSGRVRARLSLTYVAANDFWVARVAPDGPEVYWLRRGSNALLWQDEGYRNSEAPAGRFGLRGSRDAIEASLRACGKTPSTEAPTTDVDVSGGYDDGGYSYNEGGRSSDATRWRRRFDNYDQSGGWNQRSRRGFWD